MMTSRREIANIIKYLAVYGLLLVGPPTLLAIGVVANNHLHGGSMNSDMVWQSPWMTTGLLIGTLLNIVIFMGKRWAVVDLGRIQRNEVWVVIIMSVLLFLGWCYPEDFLNGLIDIEDNMTAEDYDNMTAGIAGFIDTGILTPIAEELLCRGAILGALLRLMPRRPWVAIVTQALIFGLIHMNPVQAVFGGLYGVLLGWLCWRTASLLPSIVAHVANNSIIMLMPDEVDATLSNLSPTMTSVVIAMSLAILVSAICWFKRRYRVTLFSSSVVQ